MIAKDRRSKKNIIGFKVVGKVTKEDYELLTPALHELLEEYEEVKVLFNLEEFEKEEVRAWMADLKFGAEFRKHIVKLAIVGDNKWHEWLGKLADPFFAKESKFFELEDEDEAWEWLIE